MINTRFFRVLMISLLYAAPVLAADEAAPWVSLFNGKDLTGWSLKGSTGKAYVQDGEIICHITANTPEHTFVCTNDTFTDFVLELSLKIDGDYNTGIVFRGVDGTPDAAVKVWGYMVKIDPTPRKWTGGVFEDFGDVWQWLYTLADDAPGREAFHINAWNRVRIEAIGSHFKVWVNGVPTANLIDTRYSKGFIALKIHWTGNFPEREKILAHFKDIRIITDDPKRFSQESSLPVVTSGIEDSGISVPAGFRSMLVADKLVGGKKAGDQLRFLAVAPGGTIYAKMAHSGILAIQRRNGDNRADTVDEFDTAAGTGLAVHDGYLYYSTLSAIYRYKMTAGNPVPKAEPELIVRDLTNGLSDKPNAFTFDERARLLVATSPDLNGASQPGYWRFDGAAPKQSPNDGFRYAIADHQSESIAWNPISKTLFTFVGDDHGGANLHRLKEGADLTSGKSPDPLVTLPEAGTPHQMLFYNSKQFPEPYAGGALVACDNTVCFIPFDKDGNPTGKYEIFAQASASPDAKRPFHPGGLAVAPDGGLYIADAVSGTLWRIVHTSQPGRPAVFR